jgi:hypothetical protein
MIGVRGGRLIVCSEVQGLAFSRNIEVTITPSRWGQQPAPLRPDLGVLLRHLLLAPFEAGAVGPDAMQNDGDLARDRYFGLLGADTLH